MEIMELSNVFNGKTVLVTGHTGFKGSWLCIWLRELGARVVGYALEPNTIDDNFAAAGLKTKMLDIRGDIRDLNSLKKVFTEYKPEFVFHLAAQPLVRLSYKKPLETYETNVMGTLNVLECIRRSDFARGGIMVTTDKCYENKEQIWGYRETDPLGGYEPYSSSKACAEILTSSYRSSFMNPSDFSKHGKTISTVRAGNVIGGGDWAQDRLIPDCIRALQNNLPIQLRNPHAARPWQHVLEPIYGYLLLAAKMYTDGVCYSGAWNFGPDSASIVPVRKVAEALIDTWGSGEWEDLSGSEAVHEADMLNLDCTKAGFILGWKLKLSIEEALGYSVEWYKNYKTLDAYEICTRQIMNYSKLV